MEIICRATKYNLISKCAILSHTKLNNSLPRPMDPNHDPNFGLPPEEVPHDWEYAQGSDTFKRVSKIGRSNMDFLEKLEASDGGDNTRWQVVKEIGKER